MSRTKKKATNAKRTSKRPQGAARGKLHAWAGQVRASHGAIIAQVLMWVILIAGVSVLGIAVMRTLDRWTDGLREQHRITSYHVRLVNPPRWIPDRLMRALSARLTPHDVAFEDDSLCARVHELASKEAWIASVEEIRREQTEEPGRGVICLRATYRKPAAKIRYNGEDYFVDATGVRLPKREVPRFIAKTRWGYQEYIYPEDVDDAIPEGQTWQKHYILVYGVAAAPPACGQRWAGEDVQKGLSLVQLVWPEPYANEIAFADVRNHGHRESRIDPELCLYARVGAGKSTQIRFGRFPHPDGGDWVISPTRKLDYLEQYYQQHNRLSGVHEYIDLRFDQLKHSLH